MRLAAAASEIDQLCRHLDYDTDTSANTARGLLRLRQYMLLLLPLLAAITDRRLALNSHKGVTTSLAEIGTKVARWLADGRRAMMGLAVGDALGTSLSLALVG